jgi:hypothetical protein
MIDHFYVKTRTYITLVVKKNLDNVSKCLDIFNQYRYMLIENRAIEKWILDGKHDRREYSITFQKYYQIYD